jgi:hypothetical protein
MTAEPTPDRATRESHGPNAPAGAEGGSPSRENEADEALRESDPRDQEISEQLPEEQQSGGPSHGDENSAG